MELSYPAGFCSLALLLPIEKVMWNFHSPGPNSDLRVIA